MSASITRTRERFSECGARAEVVACRAVLTVVARESSCGMRRIVIETMSDTVGSTPPPITSSSSLPMRYAMFSIHMSTAMSRAPITRP